MSLPVSNKPSGSAHYHGVSFHIGTPRRERVSEPYDNRDDAAEWASAQKERYEGRWCISPYTNLWWLFRTDGLCDVACEIYKNLR